MREFKIITQKVEEQENTYQLPAFFQKVTEESIYAIMVFYDPKDERAKFHRLEFDKKTGIPDLTENCEYFDSYLKGYTQSDWGFFTRLLTDYKTHLSHLYDQIYSIEFPILKKAANGWIQFRGSQV